MNCSIKQQQTTIGYNSIPNAIADDETAAVPLGTPTSTTTMTMGHRSSKRMLAIVAIMMLLLMVAGGAVWMRPDDGLSYDHATGSLNTAVDVVHAAGVLGSDIDLSSNAGRDLTKEEFNGLCRHFLLVSPKGDKVAPSKFYKNPIITLGISPADAEIVCAVWIHALEVAAIGGGDDDGDDGTKKVRRDLEILRNDRKLKQCDSSGPLPEYEPAQDPHLGPNPLNNMHGDSGLSDTTNYNAPTPNGKDYDNTNTTILRYVKTQSQCYTTAFNSAADRIVLLCHTIPYLDCLQKSSAACTKVTGTVLILANRTNTISCWSDPQCDPIEVLDTINLTGKGRAAGIYFYVNNNDIAVVANGTYDINHIYSRISCHYITSYYIHTMKTTATKGNSA